MEKDNAPATNGNESATEQCDFNPGYRLVVVTHGKPTTTSRVIAEKFGKRHDAVIRSIRNLECSNGFWLHNFVERDYVDERGKTYPMYEITRDGFAFLAMGFTGKKAAEWKEKFIDAFNLQAAEINRLRALHAAPDWQAARLEGKTVRREETDTIKVFVDYAKSQGSNHAGKYYMLFSKETNRALFFVESAVGKNFRDGLTAAQLSAISMAERIVERALLESMSHRVYYRDAYRSAMERVRQFSTFIGRSVPGKSVSLLDAA